MFLSFDDIHGRQCGTAKWKERDRICKKKKDIKRTKQISIKRNIRMCMSSKILIVSFYVSNAV
jgi:hypothetical protein